MYLKTLGDTWNTLGEADPMWAVLMDPERGDNRWDTNEFFETGRADVTYAMHTVRQLHFPLRRGRRWISVAPGTAHAGTGVSV